MEGEFESQAPSDIRRTGMTYDSFLYQTLLDCRRGLTNAFTMRSMENNLSAFSCVMGIHFALAIRCRNQEYWDKIYPTEVQDLRERSLMAHNNPNLQRDFMLKCYSFLDKMALELRRINFTPPRQVQMVAGTGGGSDSIDAENSAELEE